MTEFVREITTEPGDPFFTGQTTVVEQIDYSLPISVDGRGFLLDRSENLQTSFRHSRQSVDLLSTQQANNGDSDSSLPPEVWRRQAESWHQGAGQGRADRISGLPYRFNHSANVDVWDEWSMGLLPATEMLTPLGPERAFLTTVGPERFVVVSGSESFWWSSLDLDPITVGLPATVLDVCSDGRNLYTLEATGRIRKYSGPGPGSIFGTVPDMDPARPMLASVKGFIVAAGGQSLYDVTTGSPTLIFTHPLTDHSWVDVCEGLSPAYLLGGIGDRWQVYAMTLKDDATTFDPPVAVAPIPEGEVGYALGSYLGYVLIGTSTGWRFGIPAGDGSLTFGKLVESATAVRCFEGQDSFVWYGLSGSPELEQFSGLGRADLSTFVAPMTPAAAPDVSTEHYGSVSAVTTYGAGAQGAGKRIFTVEGVGVFAESDRLAEEGWLEQGSFSFNSADPKVGLYLQVQHEALAGGRIAVDIRYDSGPWREIGSQGTLGATDMGNMALSQGFHLAEIRYRLYRDLITGLAGPSVQRVEFRALNIPGRATEFRLPIMLRSNLYVEGTTSLRDPAEDYEFLVDLVTNRRMFTYREAGTTYSVHATDFLWLPEQQTENGSAYEGLFVMTVKEIR